MFNVNNNSLDRYIPRRAGENFDLSYYRLMKIRETSCNETHVMCTNYAHHQFKKQCYINSLWKTLVPETRKILNFSLPNIEKLTTDTEMQQWPMKSRKKPLINMPVVLLDMPDLNTNLCSNVVDWGHRGHIASVYRNDIHIWHPDVPKPFVYNTSECIEQCIRWNRAGTRFAVSIADSKIALMDLVSCKTIFIATCCKRNKCSISSLELNEDDVIISGCTKGKLTVWYKEIGIAKYMICAHTGPIISIKLSCNEKYVATSGLDGIVKIWLWPDIIDYFELGNFALTKMFAWHPWREPILAIGSGFGQGTLAIWNVCSRHKEHEVSSQDGTLIDNLIFNPISGELVVSYWHQQKSCYNGYAGSSVIEVLSNLNKMTDAIVWHLGRVPYLLWGPDGTQLATAGADESLSVWDFFGNTSQCFISRKKKKKQFTTIGVKNLNSFGQCIR